LEAFGMREGFVRIRATPEMQAAGLAGLVGEWRGESRPSVSGVEVVGPCPGDYAINVHVHERGQGYWLAPELVEWADPADFERYVRRPSPSPPPWPPERAGRAEANFIGRLLDRLFPD
jgi:hypothetical protein